MSHKIDREAQESDLLTVACPACKATVGQRCHNLRDGNGFPIDRPRAPHKSRIKLVVVERMSKKKEKR